MGFFVIFKLIYKFNGKLGQRETLVNTGVFVFFEFFLSFF